jgi:asparagine synthetase B (glutamine-hydrolysing)
VGELFDFDRNLGNSDLWTVAHKWREGFSNYDGFWSVVVLDEARRELHVICDYLAQKPMFMRPDAKAVASEPSALLAMGGPVYLDKVYLSAVMKWGYCPDPRKTPYLQIKRVLPGEHVVMGADGSWTSRSEDPIMSRPCTPHELKREIREAVRRRVEHSDVPVACLLSGGLDSSITYRLAREFGDVRPYYVCDDHGADIAQGHCIPNGVELANVRSVVGAKGPRVNVCHWNSVSDEDCLRYMQEPVDLGSLAPQVALSRIVAEDVCLTGDGADELFGGYSRAQRYDSQASDVAHELVCWHLQRLDRVMMRHRTEVRSPFLARAVVEMALGLPREQRTGKKILRDLFRDDLPEGIADQKKVPLRTPAVEQDREGRSVRLVQLFQEMHQ